MKYGAVAFAAPGKGAGLDITPRKVLLVDDEPLVLSTISGLLADGGYEVIEARGYEEALARLEDAPDAGVLVTDISLGGAADGLALAREAARLRPGLRIVIVSGAVRPAGGECPERAIFFTKPFAPGALLAIVGDGEAWADVPDAQPSAGSVVTAA